MRGRCGLALADEELEGGYRRLVHEQMEGVQAIAGVLCRAKRELVFQVNPFEKPGADAGQIGWQLVRCCEGLKRPEHHVHAVGEERARLHEAGSGGVGVDGIEIAGEAAEALVGLLGNAGLCECGRCRQRTFSSGV